ncbi:MAG: DNA starvation/stationary phase protection protein [Bacteroidota bacterium]
MNYLGFKPGQTDRTVDALNNLLADYHIYYQNLRNFHWNVSGENFFDLHEKFETLYTVARDRIDEIAERILTLRERPVSTMSDYLKRADVDEYGTITNSNEMVEKILANHATIIQTMRGVLKEANEISDEGTIDMVGSFLADIEKSSWMLDAWLKNSAVYANS